MQSAKLRRFRIPFLLILAFMSVTDAALAIPGFARRYGVNCNYCHDGFPKLNALGREFKERGFRMESETFELKEWLKTVPGTLRAGSNTSFVEEEDTSSSGFFKVVAAGNLGSRLSFWADRIFSVNEDGWFDNGTDNGFLRFEILPGKLYARGGRIELDLPFTQTRTPHLMAYLIYFQNTGFESDNIGFHQSGGEVGGSWGEKMRWSVAVVKGSNSTEAEALSERAGRFDGNVYGRFVRQQGAHRFGGLVYVGRNVLARRDGGEIIEWEDKMLRLGADWDLWWKKLNVYGVFIHAGNTNSIADVSRPDGTEATRTYNGGFLQADYHFRDYLVFTARGTLVRRPERVLGRASDRETLLGLSPGIQFFYRERIKISGEVGLFNLENPARGVFQVEVGL